MEIDIISVFNPPEKSKVITRAEKIRNMSDGELAHLSVTSVVLGGGINIWTMFRGAFSGVDYDSREEAERGELEWLQGSTDDA